jgi:hypothetical protein
MPDVGECLSVHDAGPGKIVAGEAGTRPWHFYCPLGGCVKNVSPVLLLTHSDQELDGGAAYEIR